jgi:arginase family enzyme
MGSEEAGMDTQSLRDGSMKFFGAALDALDTPESIDTKRAYLRAVSSAGGSQIGYRDPYALFRHIAGEDIESTGNQLLGRFSVESALSSKPLLSDFELIRAETFRSFLRNDGFRVFSELIRQFTHAHVFPCRPAMIGVDHSLTGGVLTALSEKMGPENLGVLIFDAHTDAVPLSLRGGLVEYALEKGIPAPAQITSRDYEDCYTAGNFLLDLMQSGTILPGNLVIVGPTDSEDSVKETEDRRVRDYCSHLRQLRKMGVRIVSNVQLKQDGATSLANILEETECSNLYISLDVDVSAQRGVLATRFIEAEGSPCSTILQMVREVAEVISSERFCLVGFDVMEIDVHKIGARLESGQEDQTGEFIKEFVSSLLSTE